MTMTTPHHSEPAREAVAVWPERLTLRDTKVIADEGQRIFTTATGYGYDKREYVRADLASPAPAASGGLEASEPGAGMAEMAEIARIVGEWRNGPMLSPEALRQIAAALAAPAATGGEDWRNDPTADERWNAGCDFAMTRLCAYLGVDPHAVSWDAATETVEGDVSSVIGNIFTAHFGEDWSPTHPAPSETGASVGVKAWQDVRDERRRQVEAEGWTPEHDDAHDKREMACAAACYALTWTLSPTDSKYVPHKFWPWSLDWWKPSTPRRNLVKAGALILAEIERLDRAALEGRSDG